jgi:hypothetical protein
MSIKSSVGSTLAVAAFTLASSLAAALPAHAASIGGISVANYCASNVSSGTGAASPATNINDSWDGWRCGTRYGLVEVDMNKACRQQYPTPWWKAQPWASHGSGMYSWQCNR